MTRPLYIFDLDGTLADISHRLHCIQQPKKDGDSFFAAGADEAPIEAGIRTLQALRDGGAEVWIWSGRSDQVRGETERWLRMHEVRPGHLPRWFRLRAPEALLMRKAGDHQPDHTLKLGWLAGLDPPERNRLTAVFEDRARVVEMYRQYGVACFQVAEGNF